MRRCLVIIIVIIVSIIIIIIVIIIAIIIIIRVVIIIVICVVAKAGAQLREAWPAWYGGAKSVCVGGGACEGESGCTCALGAG